MLEAISRPQAPHPVRALLHGFDVLEALATSGKPMLGVSEVARRTGLSKAATHNILMSLESRRLVSRDPEQRRYGIGWRMYELTADLIANHDVVRAARPWIAKLAEELEFTLLLATVYDDAVLYLDRFDCRRGGWAKPLPGSRSPLLTTATGKVLAAVDRWMAERVIARLERGQIESGGYTPATLRAELDAIRQAGHATCSAGHHAGVWGLSVPIVAEGCVPAALTVVGPARDFDRPLDGVIDALGEAALRVVADLEHLRQADTECAP